MLRRICVFSKPRFAAPLHRLSTTPVIPKDVEREHAEARAWLSSFNVEDLPKTICEVTFSRASGPGGQNVNKVHTKANLRIKTDDLLPLLPTLLRPSILESTYHAKKSQSLLISGDGSRGQAENLKECYRKLHAAIVHAGDSVVRGETSPEKVARVKSLQRAGDANRRKAKKIQSSKKAARKS